MKYTRFYPYTWNANFIAIELKEVCHIGIECHLSTVFQSLYLHINKNSWQGIPLNQVKPVFVFKKDKWYKVGCDR